MTSQPTKTVLVVEDERVVAKDLQRTLTGLGYRVPVTVASAEDALRAVTNQCPDLVLMDIRIRGEIDGIETAKILKRRFDVPVVYLTAYADSETVARAKATEPHGYLLKPVKHDELRSTVEVALHKHEMERRLRDRERWFATTLRSIGDAVISADANGRITFMNPVAESLTGWSTSEARGRRAADVVRLVDDATNETLEDPISSALRGGRIIHVDGSLVAREGHARAIADSAAPVIDDDGTTVGAVIVFRDVGEQRKVQHDLELTDRLASLGTMVASVAHEINNPLTLVLGGIGIALAELKKRTAELGSPAWLEDVCATLAQAEFGSEQIRNIVGDLRTIARPDPEEGGTVELRRVLEWAIDAATHELRRRVKVTTHFGRIPRVKGNETRLGQIFVNLIVNAAQAMAARPHEANEIKVTSFVDANGRVVTEIADTGPGIPEELVEKIFEPFFTTKKETGGTGLGLSICRGIVASLGGTITVESTVGTGTTFRVALDAAGDAERPSREPAAPVSPAQASVLVVDDEAMILKLANRVLGHHRVVLAQGVAAAIELLDGGDRFDVIVCDVLMPGLSGVDFYEQVLLKYPDQAPRILFVSASAFTPRSSDFLASVPNRQLSKPFDRGQLEQAVLDVIAEHGLVQT